MKINILSALVLLPSAFLASCEKELDFEYHDIDPKLVIQGAVTQHGAYVTLTETTPMDEPLVTTFITDATVSLKDDTDGTVRILHPDPAGAYTDETPGIEGHIYQVNVTRGGLSYEASAQMHEGTDITGMEFEWATVGTQDIALLQVSFKDDKAPGDYYWVRILRNGKFYAWSALSDTSSHDGIMNAVFMTTPRSPEDPDDKSVILDGDTVTAQVFGISREMFDYLLALDNDSNGPRMFEGDFCLGYFIATRLSSADTIFHND